MTHNLEAFTNEMLAGSVWNVEDEFKAWFAGPDPDQLKRERNLRLEERTRERARIARELHDTLLQGFLGASLVLHDAVEQLPENTPTKAALSHALQLMRRVIDEGRVALQGLRSSHVESTSLEQALSNLADEFAPERGARFRIFVMGKPKALKDTVQEQIYLIAREALVNAMRHSAATNIEAEVEYLPGKLRVVVRDNGVGIDPEVLRSGRDSHWGLLGMRERARGVGARLRIWSRPGAGTEVEVSVSADFVADARNCRTKSPALHKAAVA
jgi:signal transduction histidine kinase